jgi:hypothetical protein
MDPWTLTMEAWRLEMEPQRFCRAVVADSHNFDTDPHLREKLDPDPHESDPNRQPCSKNNEGIRK